MLVQGGHLFKVGCLLTFLACRMGTGGWHCHVFTVGTYSRLGAYLNKYLDITVFTTYFYTNVVRRR